MLSFIAEHSREDASALVRPAGEIMTFASLAMASAAVVQALEARVGAVAHRLVGLAVSDGAQLFASLLGVLEAGGVALILDPRFGHAAVLATAKQARALALIVGDAAEDRLDIEPVDAARLALPDDAALVFARARQPRIFTRAELATAVDALVTAQDLSATTRTALLGGANPTMLLAQGLATLRAGGTLCDVGPLDPRAQLETLTRLAANTVVAFPSQLDVMARAVLDQGAPVPPLLRIVAHAPPLSSPLAADLRRAFPDAILVNVQRSADSLQFTVPAPNQPRPEDVLEVDGETIDPDALEAELRARPGVREAAVLVVPDARLGPRLVAFVTLADERDARPWAPPARVVTLLSLPRTPDGGVDCQALRRMASPE